MADISVTPKQGGSRTWIWALIAVALVIALMVWLSQQETSSPTPVVVEDTAAVEGLAADTLGVADTLGADTAVADPSAQ
jgi:bacteriorhodopsin